jgi:hypothetical protein
MFDLYFELSSYAVYLAVLLSVIGIVIYTRLNAVLKAFTLYLIVSGAFELVAYSLSRLQQDNLHWLHLYTLLEIVTLSYFFNCVFIRMKVQYPIKIVTGIVLLFCVLNSIFLQSINSFNSYASTLVSVTIIVYCILTFYHLLDKDAEEYKKIRWLVSGLLLYQMTSFIVMAFSHISIKLDIEIDMIVWFIRLVIMLITKVIFGYVILLAALSSRKHKYSRG